MTDKIHPVTRPWLIIYLLILLLAAWARLWDGLGITEFTIDQATMATMAQRMADGEQFYWLGTPNSARIPNSPLTIWFLVLPALIHLAPSFITLFLAVWNLFGVALLGWIAHRYFGPFVGAVAMLAFAMNPWSIFYSRGIWEPRTIMPFILLAVAIGLYGFVENKRWAQLLFLPALLVAVQFHYVALPLLPIFFCMLWLGRRNISWKMVAGSILLGILAIVPHVYGLAQNVDMNEASGNRAQEIVSRIQDGSQLETKSLWQLWDLASGLGLEFMVDPQQAPLLEAAPRFDPLWMAIGVLTLAGLGVIWVKREWRAYAPLLWIWMLFPFMAILPGWTGVRSVHHHYTATLPAMSLLLALTVSAIFIQLNAASGK